MKNVILKIPGTAFAGMALLTTALFSPLLLPNQANADLLDSLKKAAEQAIKAEIENAVGVQPVQTQPDMAVYEMQVYLTYLGYDVGPSDGMLNDRTAIAIRTYQLDRGWPVTGVVTAEFLVSVKAAYTHYAQTGQRPGSGSIGSNQPTPSPPPYTTTRTTPPVITRGSSPVQVPPTSGSSASSAPASSSGGLTPTASYEQPSAGASNSATGLQVPDRWSTIENGIVMPHPVSIDGRLLTAQAIEHYGQWMGFADRRAANAALAEYLELVGVGIRPGDIEKNSMRYVMFLSKSERDRYVCPTRPMTNDEQMAAMSGKFLDGCTSIHGELVWAGSNEFETRRSRQNFIDDYRDRLVAAAPKLPIEFLDIGDAIVSHYDRTRKGRTILSYGNHALLQKGPHHRATPATRAERNRGGPLSGGGINLAIFHEPKIIGEPNPPSRYSSATIYVFWPMELAQADNPSRRKVFTLFHRTLTEYGAVTGTATAIHAKMLVSSAVAYEDPMFEREIYRFNVGGEAISAKSVQKNDSLVNTSTTPAAVEIDPASGEPIYRAGEPASAKLATLASGTDGFIPINVPSYRGAPVISYARYGWSHEVSELGLMDPIHLFFHLAHLGDHPEKLAYATITGHYLTVSARSPYMAEFQNRQHRTQCCTWSGTNKKDRFVRDFTSRFAARAPKAPFDMWINLELPISGEYDFDRRGFWLDLPIQLPDIVGQSFEFPDDFVSMSPEMAEKMFAGMHGFRVVYLSIQTEVTSVLGGPNLRTSRGAYRNPFQISVQNRLKSMNLYSDKAMTKLIQSYH